MSGDALKHMESMILRASTEQTRRAGQRTYGTLAALRLLPERTTGSVGELELGVVERGPEGGPRWWFRTRSWGARQAQFPEECTPGILAEEAERTTLEKIGGPLRHEGLGKDACRPGCR